MFGEIFKFFNPPTTKWRFFKFFAKSNENLNFNGYFSNFANIKHLVSLSCIIWANESYLIEYSSYEKAAFTISGSSNKQLLKFWLFNCSNFETTFVKNFIEIPPGFKIYSERTDKVSALRQYLWSEFSRQWNNGPLIVTWNSYGRAFCFLNFVKWRKY